ncbi:tRNA (guanine-N(7)-)-methyltransferase [Balamuthia mandrillaris]
MKRSCARRREVLLVAPTNGFFRRTTRGHLARSTPLLAHARTQALRRCFASASPQHEKVDDHYDDACFATAPVGGETSARSRWWSPSQPHQPVRARPCINPLASRYLSHPVFSPDSAAEQLLQRTAPFWERAFADPSLPLHLDLGCGKGTGVWNLAIDNLLSSSSSSSLQDIHKEQLLDEEQVERLLRGEAPAATHNFLGVDVHTNVVLDASVKTLLYQLNVKRSSRSPHQRQLLDENWMPNLQYLWACNANVCLEPLLRSLHLFRLSSSPLLKAACNDDALLLREENKILTRATIIYPDPWHKRKHHKRRVVTTELLATLHKYLRKGGQVYVETDVWPLFCAIEEVFAYFPSPPPPAKTTDDDEEPALLPSTRRLSCRIQERMVGNTAWRRGTEQEVEACEQWRGHSFRRDGLSTSAPIHKALFVRR